MHRDNCDCSPAHSAAMPSRRAVVMSIVCAAILPVTSGFAAVAPTAADDERFMRMAIEQARRADFPFGAVIVRNNHVIARGRNRGRTLDDPTAHGEMSAIRNALAAHGSKAVAGSTIYATGEPCAMCMGAILWCNMGRLVYAASLAQLSTRIDQIAISSAEMSAKATYAPISITGGVLADEALALVPKLK